MKNVWFFFFPQFFEFFLHFFGQVWFSWVRNCCALSWELTYPFPKKCLKMILLFPRSDMLVPWKVLFGETHNGGFILDAYFHITIDVLSKFQSQKTPAKPAFYHPKNFNKTTNKNKKSRSVVFGREVWSTNQENHNNNNNNNPTILKNFDSLS